MDTHAIEHQLEDINLKIAAILEALQLDMEYQPKKYTLVQKPTEDASEE